MKLEKFNPTVKAATALVCVILLSFQYLIFLNCAVFLISLLLLVCCSDVKPKRIAKLLLPAVAAAFGLFVTGFFHGRQTPAAMEEITAMPYAVRAAMSGGLYPALQLSTRLLAFAGFGILFSLTTDGELFIASLMHQCKLPAGFAYGILAAVHLMPNMRREYRAVKLAYRTRASAVHWYSLQPVFTMLVNSVRWSQCIAMAMESKGFSGSQPRTCRSIVRVHWYDLAYSALWIGGIAAVMIKVGLA